MNKDYTYCIALLCDKKSECKRALVNYSDKEVKELYTKDRFINTIERSDCIEFNDTHNLFDNLK